MPGVPKEPIDGGEPSGPRRLASYQEGDLEEAHHFSSCPCRGSHPRWWRGAVGAMEKALKVEVGEDKVAQRRRLGESKFLHE